MPNQEVKQMSSRDERRRRGKESGVVRWPRTPTSVPAPLSPSLLRRCRGLPPLSGFIVFLLMSPSPPRFLSASPGSVTPLVPPFLSFLGLYERRFAYASYSRRCRFAMKIFTLFFTMPCRSSGSLALAFRLPSSFSSFTLKNFRSCSRHCIQSSSCPLCTPRPSPKFSARCASDIGPLPCI